MKKFKTLLIAATAALMVTSCSNDKQFNPLDNAVYYPVKTERNGNWGMMDSKGKMLFENEFRYAPTVPCEGVFFVYEGTSLTAYTAEAKPKPILENMAEAGYANEGLIVFSEQDSEIKVADTKGNVKFTLPGFRKAQLAFQEGMLAVYDEDGKVGYVNKKGETVIKPKYAHATVFSNGVAFAMDVKEDFSTEIVIIDKSGKEITKLKEGVFPIREFSYNVALAYTQTENGPRLGFLDKKGEFTKLPEKVESVNYYDDKIIVFNSNHKWGIMTRDGEVTVRAKYSSIQPMNDPSKFLAHIGDKYLIIDKEGNELHRIDYKRATVISGKGFQLAGREGNLSILLDADGNPIKNTEFVEMSNDFVKSYGVQSHKMSKPDSNEK